MKTKLLKKLRKRFKWQYIGIEKLKNKIFDYQWLIFDKKATEPYKIENVNSLSIEAGYYSFNRLTAAEQLVSEVIGYDYIKEHRRNVYIRKNKTFIKQNWG